MRRRFVQLQGELVEVTPDYQPEPKADYHIMPDIKPYQSMADGTMVGSRSTHREMLKRNGCIEVGDQAPTTAQPRPDINPQGRHELIRAQVDAMRHDDLKRMLKRDLDRIRWNSRDR